MKLQKLETKAEVEFWWRKLAPDPKFELLDYDFKESLEEMWKKCVCWDEEPVFTENWLLDERALLSIVFCYTTEAPGVWIGDIAIDTCSTFPHTPDFTIADYKEALTELSKVWAASDKNLMVPTNETHYFLEPWIAGRDAGVEHAFYIPTVNIKLKEFPTFADYLQTLKKGPRSEFRKIDLENFELRALSTPPELVQSLWDQHIERTTVEWCANEQERQTMPSYAEELRRIMAWSQERGWLSELDVFYHGDFLGVNYALIRDFHGEKILEDFCFLKNPENIAKYPNVRTSDAICLKVIEYALKEGFDYYDLSVLWSQGNYPEDPKLSYKRKFLPRTQAPKQPTFLILSSEKVLDLLPWQIYPPWCINGEWYYERKM